MAVRGNFTKKGRFLQHRPPMLTIDTSVNTDYSKNFPGFDLFYNKDLWGNDYFDEDRCSNKAFLYPRWTSSGSSERENLPYYERDTRERHQAGVAGAQNTILGRREGISPSPKSGSRQTGHRVLNKEGRCFRPWLFLARLSILQTKTTENAPRVLA